jgi:hypothetical protein
MTEDEKERPVIARSEMTKQSSINKLVWRHQICPDMEDQICKEGI